MRRGMTVQISTCYYNYDSYTNLTLFDPRTGGQLASDGEKLSCQSAGGPTKYISQGALLSLSLPCNTSAGDATDNDYELWTVVQSCTIAACGGLTILNVTDYQSCVPEAPPPPAVIDLCGEYEASGTNSATDKAASMGCDVTLFPGFSYIFQPACDEIIEGVAAFSLVDPFLTAFALKHSSITCDSGLVPGQNRSTQYAYEFGVPCAYPVNATWTLLRGCQANSACKSTPQVLELPGYACNPPAPSPPPGQLAPPL